MKIQVTGGKISRPVFVNGKYSHTEYLDKYSDPVDLEEELAKRLIAKGYAEEVGKKIKPAKIKTDKPKKLEVADEKSGTLPPGAEPVSKKG